MKDVKHLLKRHAAFWRMEGEALIDVGRYAPLEKGDGVPLPDGRRVSDNMTITPEMVEPELFLAGYRPPRSPVDADFFHAWAPYGLCWMEAIMGCPIQVSVGSIWSRPFLTDWRDPERLRVTPNNPWLQKLLQFTRLLTEKTRGRVPVTLPLMRGLTDLATAMLGPERMCVALKTDPAGFERLLDVCTDGFLTTVKSLLSVMPRFHNGYVVYGVWAPGTVVRTQADNSTLISARDYERLILPLEARILDCSDYSFFHLHSGGSLHLADSLVEVPELDAVEVAIDPPPFSPPLDALLPVLKRIHDRKQLILTGPTSREGLQKALASLKGSGLALRVQEL